MPESLAEVYACIRPGLDSRSEAYARINLKPKLSKGPAAARSHQRENEPPISGPLQLSGLAKDLSIGDTYIQHIARPTVMC